MTAIIVCTILLATKSIFSNSNLYAIYINGQGSFEGSEVNFGNKNENADFSRPMGGTQKTGELSSNYLTETLFKAVGKSECTKTYSVAMGTAQNYS